MPHIEAPGQLSIAFGGNSAASRHTSLDGAKMAVLRAGSQSARMLVLYHARGASSDGELAEILGLPEGRISARRDGLMKKDLVQFCEIVEGPHGAKVCKWCLTVRGIHVAASLKAEQR